MTQRKGKQQLLLQQRLNNALHKFGCFISILEMAAAIAALMMLIRSALLPDLYLAIIAGILILFIIIFRILMGNAGNRKTFWIGFFLALITSAISCLAIPYIDRIYDTLRSITSFPGRESTQTEYEGGPFIMYISGIDTRDGELIDSSRSDVNILAIVNPDTHQVLLLSTPRDTFLELSVSEGQKDKLTHAGIYGIDCLMDTLEMFYGVDIDYYFRIDFTGFINVVDSLGGITVYVDQAFTAWTDPDCTFEVGYTEMNGREALAFARERYSFEDGDLDRGKNQMKVITAILEKMQTTAVLKNFSGLMNTISDNFATSMSYDMLAALVREQLSSGEEWNITHYNISGYGAYEYTYSGGDTELYVLMPYEETVEIAKGLIQTVMDGGIPDPPEALPLD